MDVSFVPMAAVSEEGMLLEAKTRKVKEVKKSFPHFKERDVLVAKITPCFENGKRWLASSLVNGVGFGSTEFHVLRAGKEVLPGWIYYFISSPTLRKDGKGRMTGTAGQKRVPASFLEQYKIPVPPITVQETIVRTLRKAEKLREIREQANQLTSKIIQSVFLKMFGDPSVNPMRWEIVTIGNIATDTQYGLSKGLSDNPKHAPIIRMNNITFDGYLDLSEIRYVDLSRNEFEKYELHKGDVLFNRTNSRELVGKTGLVTTQTEFVFASYLIRVNTKKNVCTPEYLWAFLNSAHGKKILLRTARGAVGQANINSQELTSIQMPLPAYSLQERFSAFSHNLEKLKLDQIQSSQEIDELFQSLLQKAFRGELVPSLTDDETRPDGTIH